MNRMFLYWCCLFLFPLILCSQTKDTIRTEYAAFSNSYFIGDNKYSKSEIKDFLKEYEETRELINSSNSQKTWGWIVLGAGILLTANSAYEMWQYANNYGVSPLNSTTNVLLAALSLGADITGIILISGSNKTFNKAIKKYNKKTKTTEIPIRIFFTGIGLGLRLNL